MELFFKHRCEVEGRIIWSKCFVLDLLGEVCRSQVVDQRSVFFCHTCVFVCVWHDPRAESRAFKLAISRNEQTVLLKLQLSCL